MAPIFSDLPYESEKNVCHAPENLRCFCHPEKNRVDFTGHLRLNWGLWLAISRQSLAKPINMFQVFCSEHILLICSKFVRNLWIVPELLAPVLRINFLRFPDAAASALELPFDFSANFNRICLRMPTRSSSTLWFNAPDVSVYLQS